MRPYKLALLGLAASLLAATAAAAQTCTAYPNTLTNGNPADAGQVMADFNCAALVGKPNFSGEVIITPSTPGYALDAAGIGRFQGPNSGTTGAVIIRDAPGNPGDAIIQFTNNASTAQTGFIVGLNAGGLALIGGGGTGNVGVNTGSPTLNFYVNGSAGGTQAWSSSSDARLKKNIETITGALDLVERLRGVRFEWRPVGEREVGKTLALPVGQPRLGFIAQEVEKVAPEAVTAPKKGSDETYTVSETSLIPVLVQAVKEQQAEVKAQQAEIEQLRVEVAALKAGK